MYAANQSGNDISLFNIDSDTGELTEVMPRTPAGLNPTSLVMDSGGDLIFVANQTSNNISVFSVSASDGTLTEVPGSPVPHRCQAGRTGLVAHRDNSFTWEAEICAFVFGYSVASERAAWRRFLARRLRLGALRLRWLWIPPDTFFTLPISASTRCRGWQSTPRPEL